MTVTAVGTTSRMSYDAAGRPSLAVGSRMSYDVAGGARPSMVAARVASVQAEGVSPATPPAVEGTDVVDFAANEKDV